VVDFRVHLVAVNSVCNSERIINYIASHGKNLTLFASYAEMKKGPVFVTHSVVSLCCFKLVVVC